MEEIGNKRVLLRADFDVSLNADGSINNDTRIKINVPTIKLLLANGNRVICIAKLGRPKGPDPTLSLKVVCDRLKQYFPNNNVTLVEDFLTDSTALQNQQPNEIIVLENIRFYPQEKANDPEFAKKLAALGDVFVNDAFAMCHRSEASTVGIAKLLHSYPGLQLRKEIEMLSKVTKNPQKPVVSIMGGAKISTKITVMQKLSELSDAVLTGGGIANILLKAKGMSVGKSLVEDEGMDAAKKLMSDEKIIVPIDVIVGAEKDSNEHAVKSAEEVSPDEMILDIGPETLKNYRNRIADAKTIIWNGPVGYVENAVFRTGTDGIYDAIINNAAAVSVVGGGDTLTAIEGKENMDKITHISTGGGAMLEFIEKGTLPGIEVLQ